jgi:multidrug efflux pump subunit AcrA (membrane-fusion protein)
VTPPQVASPTPLVPMLPEKPPTPAPPVLPESVATIDPTNPVVVKAPRAGYIVRRVYRDYATVEVGDVLFLLDPQSSHLDQSSDGSAARALIKVMAPRKGVAGFANHGPGDWVEMGEDLTSIGDIDNTEAQLDVPEELAQKFTDYLNELVTANATSRQNIELILPDNSLYSQSGVVTNLLVSGNTYTLIIDFPNPKHVLQPGEFVKVRSAIK